MVYRAELYPQVDLMIGVSFNKLRLYKIVLLSILLAKNFTTKIIFQNFQGVFISIKIGPKFLWGLIYQLKHIQEPPPLSCQQSQTSSIDNAIFLY